MERKLFKEFDAVSAKQWKQQIQFELKGADYNETLVWESPEGIKVKPFYHSDEFKADLNVSTKASEFKILQNIFVFDVLKSNARAIESLSRGAENIRFTINNDSVAIETLMANLPTKETTYYFNLSFLSVDYISKLNEFATKNNFDFVLLIDPVGRLATDGNWYQSLEKDFESISQIQSKNNLPLITIQSNLYQNAGANMVQQLAYTLAHLNEYFNRLGSTNNPITIEVAVGTNYFFEIAKLRALRLLFNTLAETYNHKLNCKIVVSPTKRNKTIYDYNVNLLRTTTECMSAILGGADAVANLPYDALYHKDNEFGDRSII